jgi:hypothetical protein
MSDPEHEQRKAEAYDKHVYCMEKMRAVFVYLMVLGMTAWAIWSLIVYPESDRRRELPTLVIHLVLGVLLALLGGSLWLKWADRGRP